MDGVARAERKANVGCAIENPTVDFSEVKPRKVLFRVVLARIVSGT